MKRMRKTLSLLLALALCLGLMPVLSMTALADTQDTTYYVNAAGEEQKSVTEFTAVDSTTATWTKGWYVVNADTSIASRITVTGDVNLILCDGATLTATQGITVASGNSLTIWAQSNGTGKLYAGTTDGTTASLGWDSAGIGGDASNTETGTITVNGGTIYAVGNYGAGIGGGYFGSAGTIKINGGEIHATGGYWAAGVGSGPFTSGSAGSVEITGGKVYATGGTSGAGIGAGSHGEIGFIAISGAATVIEAQPKISMWGGGQYAAGIGGGEAGAVGTITITGGSITAKGSNGGPGIGAGGEGICDTITITGGSILSSSNTASSGGEAGPGIGCGFNATINQVVIGGSATVKAVAGYSSYLENGSIIPAIGPGVRGTFGALTLYDTARVWAGTDKDVKTAILAWPDERADACKKNVYAEIKPCDHEACTEIWITAEKHYNVRCQYCLSNKDEEAHNFQGNDTLSVCSVCHAVKVAYVNDDGTAAADSPKVCLQVTGNMSDVNGLGGWYAVAANTQLDTRIEVTGDVNLILCDGATLTAPKGIQVPEGASLTIWSQSGGTGALSAGVNGSGGCDANCAGIGGGSGDAGSITINGGSITAYGGMHAAGIGAGHDGKLGGSITVYGGNVTAVGGEGAPGMGGGTDNGTLTLGNCVALTVGDDKGSAAWIMNGPSADVEHRKAFMKTHAHSYTYSVPEGAAYTIVADCGREDCVLDNNRATLTIQKPAHTAYGDGETAEAIIVDDSGLLAQHGKREPVCGYYVVDADTGAVGEALSGAPVQAGSYRAAVALGGVTAFVDYEITRAPLTITADSDTKVYDGEALIRDSHTHTALAAGDSVESVTVTGSQTEVGKSNNVPSAAKLVNAAGTDVTASYEITYVNGTLEVTQRPSSGDYAPAAPSITIPVTGSVRLSVTVSGSSVTVAALSSSQLEQIAKSDEPVVFDLSALGEEITEVNIPANTFKKLAEALEQRPEGADKTVTIQTAMGEVTFDAAAVKVIAANAADGNVTLDFALKGVEELSEVQQAALEGMNALGSWSLSMLAGSVEVTSFEGGAAIVAVPFTPADGTDGADYVFYYVSPDGKIEKMETYYEDGKLHVIVPHFSDYVLVYEPPRPFTDVTEDDWFHEAVYYCFDNGLFQGVGGGLFDPAGTTSRAMIVTILWRLEGEPETAADNPFTDVADGQWYTDAVLWAAENNIVNGYGNGKFGPNDSITREQLAAILYRYAQSKGQGFTGMWYFPLDYPDVAEVSSWADEAMHWCVMNGVINGKDGKLVPGGDASRAEAATMLMRYCTKLSE